MIRWTCHVSPDSPFIPKNANFAFTHFMASFAKPPKRAGNPELLTSFLRNNMGNTILSPANHYFITFSVE